jgi:hypothetical protein
MPNKKKHHKKDSEETEDNKIKVWTPILTIKATPKQLFIFFICMFIGFFVVFNLSCDLKSKWFNFSTKPIKIKKSDEGIQIGTEKRINIPNVRPTKEIKK